jgi:hypothetical protein
MLIESARITDSRAWHQLPPAGTACELCTTWLTMRAIDVTEMIVCDFVLAFGVNSGEYAEASVWL